MVERHTDIVGVNGLSPFKTTISKKGSNATLLLTKLNEMRICLIATLFMMLKSQPYQDTLYKGELDIEPVVTGLKLNPQEVESLARIVYAEGSVNKEDYEAIAHVAVVRAKYKNKSVTEIISNKKQFNGYKSKKWYKTPNVEAYAAATKALTGQLWDKYPRNLYYFHNPKTATNKSWVKYISQYSIGMIGNHEFCLNIKIK